MTIIFLCKILVNMFHKKHFFKGAYYPPPTLFPRKWSINCNFPYLCHFFVDLKKIRLNFRVLDTKESIGSSLKCKFVICYVISLPWLWFAGANTVPHLFRLLCFDTGIFMFLKLEFISAIVNDRHSCLYSWRGCHHNSSLSAMPVRPPLCATPTSE